MTLRTMPDDVLNPSCYVNDVKETATKGHFLGLALHIGPTHQEANNCPHSKDGVISTRDVGIHGKE